MGEVCWHCGQVLNSNRIEKEEKEFKNSSFNIIFDVDYTICDKCNHKIYPDKRNIRNTNISLRLIIAKILKEKKFDEILKYKFLQHEDSQKEIIEKVKNNQNYNHALTQLNLILQTGNIKLLSVNDNDNHNKTNKGNEISELNDFIEKIFQKYSNSQNEKKIKLWYRGQRNSSWELIPGAFRKESEIFLEFKKYQYFRLNIPAFTNAIDYKNNGELLAFMQHYGVNTRLLDWTESPLCALYFALKDHDYETDAAIFCLDIEKLNSLDKSLNGAIPILNSDFDPIFYENYVEHGFYDELFPFELNPVGVMIAKQFDRIKNQQGNFTIHTNSIDMYKLLPNIVDKYIIPKECIEKIQSQLYILGISETMFFNDVEALAKIANSRLYINNNYKL